MNLQELLQKGKTFSVSNTQKGGNIEDKLVGLITVKVPTSTKLSINSDLTLSVKDYIGSFTLSKDWFVSQPTLENKGVGLTPIIYENKGFLYLCEDRIPNDLQVTPLFLNNKKGVNKALTFKSQALEITVKQVKEIDYLVGGIYHFKLIPTQSENLFEIVNSEMELELNIDDVIMQNSSNTVPASEVNTIINTTDTENLNRPTVFMQDELDAPILEYISNLNEEILEDAISEAENLKSQEGITFERFN